MKKVRPKKGDRVEIDRGKGGTRTGTVIAVDEIGVHYVVKTDGGRLHRAGLSAILKILESNPEPEDEQAK